MHVPSSSRPDDVGKTARQGVGRTSQQTNKTNQSAELKSPHYSVLEFKGCSPGVLNAGGGCGPHPQGLWPSHCSPPVTPGSVQILKLVFLCPALARP